MKATRKNAEDLKRGRRKMTNYEKIKQMNIDEMANIMPCPCGTDYIDCEGSGLPTDCIKCTKDWLLKEAE